MHFSSGVPPSRRSLVLQGFGLDVVGDPPASGQRQDGVVDGGHFHSQGDGVLVLAVHRAVVLAQREEGVGGWGRDKRSHPGLRDAPPTPTACSLPVSGRWAPVGKGQTVG